MKEVYQVFQERFRKFAVDGIQVLLIILTTQLAHQIQWLVHLFIVNVLNDLKTILATITSPYKISNT